LLFVKWPHTVAVIFDEPWRLHLMGAIGYL
jgi:hypothetical protein